MSRLRSTNLTLSYGAGMPAAVKELSLTIPDGGITTIIGPNGCGKSTLLRALARLLRPAGGDVLLDGQLIHRLPAREVAKRLGLLHQQPLPPDGITVEDLARRGRYPHQSFFQPPSARDTDAVERALHLTGMSDLRGRALETLSGGQRQRAWLAFALAQETDLLLLDEPTTYLDITHQLEVLDLVHRLNRELGRTIVMVLHDLNEAARVSDHLVAMRDGRIVAEGSPEAVLQPHILSDLYGVEFDITTHPDLGHPFSLPRSRVDPDARPAPEAAPVLETAGLRAGYGRVTVLDGVSLNVRRGEVTVVIGPNACGKSTLLRAAGRHLRPSGGAIQIEGRPHTHGSGKAFARRLAQLSQGPVPPDGILVEDLVATGRYPHQSLLRRWSHTDEAVVEAAIERCGLTDLRFRTLETLSGGQRQRVWAAMVLAQQTPILLLDEPTTFLDPGHQIELLDLARALNRQEGKSVVAVLHDLNLAARYADTLVAMRDGNVVAAGPPHAVLTEATVRDVFSIEARVVHDPRTGAPLVLPLRPLHPDQEEAQDATAQPVTAGIH